MRDPSHRTFDDIANGLLYGSFVAFLFVAGLIFLDRSEGLRVKEISVENSYYVPAADIHADVVSAITGSVCWRIVACDHVLFFPRKQIIQRLMRNFPRLETVDITTEGTRMIVRVQERTHVALACIEDKTQCWFIDSLGVAFAQSPLFSDGVYMSFTIPRPLTALPYRVLPRTLYSSINAFRKEVDAGITTITFDNRSVSLMMDAIDDTEFDQPILVHISRHDILGAGPDSYITRVFKRLWSSEKMGNAIRSGKVLQYIDLRFTGKVFFKFAE